MVARSARADDDVPSRARWVAGVTPLAGRTADWTSYASLEDARWSKARARFDVISAWARREIAPSLPAGRAVLYPFAGADALYATLLFADAQRLVLVGLEPVGRLPRPGDVAPGFFSRLGASSDDLHRLGFLRTAQMAADLARDGVLPGVVATLVRLGGTVRGVTAMGPRRARVDWTSASGDARRLDYVQADLSNLGLKRESALVAELRALAPFATFLKAAMYLLAEPRFSFVRRELVEGSALVVEDDTGLPFHDFDARWAVRLYGRYAPPRKPFEHRRQPDLERAFALRAPATLPFGFGYAMLPNLSSLLVATKGT
jgi:hypothetical protein